MSPSLLRFRTRSVRAHHRFQLARTRGWMAVAWLAAPLVSTAATLTWTGTGGNNLISNGSNWSTGVAPASGDILNFAGTTGLDPQLATNLTAAQIVFASGAGAFVLGGNAQLTINTSGILNSSSQTQTLNTAILLGASQKWTATGGSLAFGGAINTNAKTLTIDGAANTTISGALSGTGKITKTGTGTLILSGNNVHSGINTLTSGTLALGSNTALGTNVLNFSSATLRAEGGPRTIANAVKFTGNGTIAGAHDLVFTKLVNQTASRTVTINNTGLTTFAGGLALSSSSTSRTLTLAGTGDLLVSSAVTNGSTATTGSLIKTSTGTLTFSGTAANTYSGTTIINAGTLVLAKSGVNAIAGTLVVGDTAGTDTVRLAGANQIADTSAITVNSAGTLDLDDFSDTVGSIAGAGKIDLGSGVLTTGGLNTSTSFSGLLTGTGGLTKTGSGTLTLGGNANALGTLAISGGKVALGAAGALSSATKVSVTGTGILDSGDFNNSVASLDFNGGTVQTASGLLTLTGNLSATSLGAVSATLAGKLGLSGAKIFTVNSGGGASVDLSISAAISGSGAGFTKEGTGVLLLSGVNTFDGDTVVNNGTLRLAGGSALADAGRVTLASGTSAALDLGGSSETIGSLAGGGQIQLGAGTLTTGGSGASTSYAGAISGTGGLVKAGAGVFTLTGGNTYSGTTTLQGGTLCAGGASSLSAGSAYVLADATGVVLDLAGYNATLGSLAGGGLSGGNVQLGAGTLTVGGNQASTTFAGTISGSGGNLTKTGSGTLTVTGAQTLSGAVVVEAGTLSLAGSSGKFSANSSFTLRSGGTLSLDNSTASNPDRVSGSSVLNLDGGTLSFVSGAAGATESLGTFNLTGGSSTVRLEHGGGAGNATVLNFGGIGNLAAGATVSFSATGGVLGSAATGPQIYIAGLSQGFIGGWATVGSDFAEYDQYGVRAITGYYTGANGINVNDAAQIPILTGTSPGTATTLSNAGTTTDKALNLADVGSVSLGTDASRTLNLATGGLVKSTTIATSISGSGRLTAGGTVAGNLAITVGSGSALGISAPIIDNAGADGIYGNAGDGVVTLIKGGSGTLTLSGASTYTGGNLLNEGIVAISAENHLGAAANGITFNGGTLQVSNGFTTSSGKILTVLGGASGTLHVTSGNTLTLANSAGRLVSGDAASSLLLAGPGALIIQNANSGFTGTTQVSAGTLELRHGQSLGGAITLTGGTLKLRNDAGTAFGNRLTIGTSSTIDVDRLSGTSPAVAHSLGNLSIGASTLTVSGGNGSALALGTTTLSGNATFNTTTAGLSLGAVTGAYSLTKTGSAALTLTAASTYTGATALNAGTLRIGAANAASAASAHTLASGTTLDLAGFAATVGSLAGSGNVTLGSGTLTAGGNDSATSFSGIISGTGGLTKSGTGIFTLAGANSYSGTTAITRGTLQLGAADRIADSSAVSVSSGAILALANFSETIGSLTGSGTVSLGSGILTTGGNSTASTFSGDISGTGQLRKSGTATLTLSGANSYSGATAIQSGVINARNANAFGTTAGGVSVSSGAALELQGNVGIGTEALTLNGSGIGGAGALRSVSGDNSWAGNLTLAGATTLATDAGTLVISGAIATGTNLLTLTGSGLTSLNGTISGSAGITKNAGGTLLLAAASNFTGTTQVNGGTTVIQNAAALGAGGDGNGTTVASGATLRIDDETGLTISTEQLTLNGSGIAGSGALASTSGSNEWKGTVSLASDVAIAVTEDSLLLSGIISGASRALTKTGAGDLTLSAANTYSGATFVSEGSLVLSAGSLASTTVSVSSGASLSATGALSSTTALTANGVARFDGSSRTISSLEGGSSGSLVLDGSTLSVGSGNFQGIVADGTLAGSLIKTSAGTLTLSGANSYTGTTQVSAGTLAVRGDQSAAIGAVTVGSSATLAGSGTLGGATTLQNGATHAADASQTFRSSLTYAAGSIFAWDISTAGGNAAYDKISAASLGGSGSVFQIVLASGESFNDAFWNTNRTWTDVFTTQSATALATIFSGGFGGSVPTSGIVADRGQFTLTGSSLSWSNFSAVPEPTSALGGLLLGAGLLLRRRPRPRQPLGLS